VPPAALCIHLCIGMAYGFSVFWLPLSHALGSRKRKRARLTLLQELFDDLRLARRQHGLMYCSSSCSASAAIWGGRVERAGPRKAGLVAALCWCGGLLLGAIIYIHQLWLMWLGSGVIGVSAWASAISPRFRRW
jgi:hypothetical protein